MRLDFNVLWVDDQPEAIKAEVYKIKQYMYDHGFAFNVTHCKDVAELENNISDDIFTDQIDLVMVDWDLGHGIRGQDAILKIREAIRYKDIIFYSSRTETSVLRKIAFDSGIEGVFVATKVNLVAQVEGVFEALTKKVLDLDHTRGIVMGATSDIDELIRNCLIGMHKKSTPEEREKLFNKVQALVESKLKDTDKRLRKLSGTKSLPEIFDAHDLFHSLDRLRMIGEMLDDKKYDEHSDARSRLAAYIQKGSHDRNTLAHAVAHIILDKDGRPEGVATTTGKIINIDDMKSLRITLLDTREAMRALEAAVAK